MSENTTNFLFSGKVYCGLCNWKYRAKKERNKKVYICSKYSTGKDGGCERHKVDEQHLELLIENQFKIYDLPLDRFDLLQAIVVTRENITISGKKKDTGEQSRLRLKDKTKVFEDLIKTQLTSCFPAKYTVVFAIGNTEP